MAPAARAFWEPILAQKSVIEVCLAAGIGVGAILLRGPGTSSPIGIVLVAAAVLPWVLEFANVPIPRLAFAAMVLAPPVSSPSGRRA